LLCLTLLGLAGKVTGAKWEGSKTVFDEDANDASQDPEQRQAASRQDAALAGLSQAVSQDHPDHVSESQDALPKMKWKKMALAELQKVMTHVMAHVFRRMIVSCQCYMRVVTWAMHSLSTICTMCHKYTVWPVMCWAGLCTEGVWTAACIGGYH